MISNQGCNKYETFIEMVYDYLRSVKHHADNGSSYSKFIIKLMQIDCQIKNPGIIPFFIKERAKYIEYLKANFFKG